MSSTKAKPIPKHYRTDDPSWDTVDELAELLAISRLAAAERLLEITLHPSYLVCLKNSAVDWFRTAPAATRKVEKKEFLRSISKDDWTLVPFKDWFEKSMWDSERLVWEWGTTPDKTGCEYVLLCEEEVEDE